MASPTPPQNEAFPQLANVSPAEIVKVIEAVGAKEKQELSHEAAPPTLPKPGR